MDLVSRSRSLFAPSETLSSAFQPVFSLSHGRVVGHEALLRVTCASGRTIPPNLYFDKLPSAPERVELDMLALERHLGAYVYQGKANEPEWLFLNVHPASLAGRGVDQDRISHALSYAGIRPERLVIEVLESALEGSDKLYPSIARLRELGCLIALDDFGAGHSNFERVFDIQPHIVKLDRKLLLRAKHGPRFLRILQRMVSVLHECGSLVLMEGIETVQGAHIALTCDVDFVQGYYFGRPLPEMSATSAKSPPLEDAWNTFDVTLSREEDRWRQSLAKHCERLRMAASRLIEGDALAEACAAFLAQPEAAMCYLLDDSGLQVGKSVFGAFSSSDSLESSLQFEPLHDCYGARWSRRQYFRRAISIPGEVHLTRPYLTLQGGRMCFTTSIAFELNGRIHILCGDLLGSEKVEP